VRKRHLVSIAAAACLLWPVGSATAACNLRGLRPDKALGARVDRDPSFLLISIPRGGLSMKGAVVGLVADSIDRLPKITAIVLSANSEQRLAIAQGLRDVADLCGIQDDTIRQRIERAVLRTNLPSFVQAYESNDNIGLDEAGGELAVTAAPDKRSASSYSPVNLDDPTTLGGVGDELLLDPFAPQKTPQ
jgi:hypothetical protein